MKGAFPRSQVSVYRTSGFVFKINMWKKTFPNKYDTDSQGQMTKMAAMAINSKNL